MNCFHIWSRNQAWIAVLEDSTYIKTEESSKIQAVMIVVFYICVLVYINWVPEGEIMYEITTLRPWLLSVSEEEESDLNCGKSWILHYGNALSHIATVVKSIWLSMGPPCGAPILLNRSWSLTFFVPPRWKLCYNNNFWIPWFTVTENEGDNRYAYRKRFQYCFNQWKIHMELLGVGGGVYFR